MRTKLAGVGVREEKKAETRRRLLDAAAEVFARKGYQGTSVDDVAKAAGLTKGAVYSNFEGKDGLFAALLDERMSRPMLAIAADVAAGTIEEQAKEAARRYLAVLDSNRELWLLGNEFFMHAARNPAFQKQFRERLKVQMRVAAESIEARAAEAGYDMPIPAMHLAVIATALFDGLSQQRANHPELVPDELFAEGMTLLFEGLAARAGGGGPR